MDREVQAAVTIQAYYRRYAVRKSFQQKQEAAKCIQNHASRFLARRQAAKEIEEQRRAARFSAVMARHQERIQALEQEKRLIHSMPLEDLDALQAKRHAAATTIQAYWRGGRQRQQIRRAFPAVGCMRPIACCSPTLPDVPTGLLACGSGVCLPAAQRSQHHMQPVCGHTAYKHHQHQLDLPATANLSLFAQPTTHAAAGNGDGQLMSSTSKWAVTAEESSWILGEDSKLSARGGDIGDGLVQEHSSSCQRRAAMPAANRAMLDRQIAARVAAVRADASTLRAVRERQQQTEERLQQLLEDHRNTKCRNLKAARRRQKLLQKADVLHSHLRQLGGLQQLEYSRPPPGYSLPQPGSIRSERAQQAHAMAMGDSRVHNKWWTPLKALNHLNSAWAIHGGTSNSQDCRAADEAGFVKMQQNWKQEECVWRASWAFIVQQEGKRS